VPRASDQYSSPFQLACQSTNKASNDTIGRGQRARRLPGFGGLVCGLDAQGVEHEPDRASLECDLAEQRERFGQML